MPQQGDQDRLGQARPDAAVDVEEQAEVVGRGGGQSGCGPQRTRLNGMLTMITKLALARFSIRIRIRIWIRIRIRTTYSHCGREDWGGD